MTSPPDAPDCINATLARAIMATSDAPILVLAPDGAILQFNPTCEALSGYSASDACGRKVWEFLIAVEDVRAVRRVFLETLESDSPTRFVNAWLARDGSKRIIEWTNMRIDGPGDDGPACVLSTGVDVTDARNAQTALTESEAYLKAVIDASPVAIVTASESGEILSFSARAEAMFGYAARDIRGKPIETVLPPRAGTPDGSAGATPWFGRARARPAEVSARRAGGDAFPAVLTLGEFMDGQRVLVAFIEDVTEKRRTERRLSEVQDQLEHTGRLAAMGEIAASIAHELNQPLTAAASLAGAVSLRLGKAQRPELADAQAMLADVVSEIRRASEIIRRTRDFVRKRKTVRDLHSLNTIVEEAAAVALIGAEANGVAVDMDLAPDAPTVRVDRLQIQQVLVNLIRNALEAMNASPIKRLRLSTAVDGDLIEVMVEDSGAGVIGPMKRRLFEPFVTDKEDGMGIGLSISKSIVDAHKGEIRVAENSPTGAVFTVRLPHAGQGDVALHGT